jgi:CubicO group peptidase (beta-lactamase class C family)
MVGKAPYIRIFYMRQTFALKICWILFAGASLLLTSGCATSDAKKTSEWRFAQGVGSRADGPEMSVLGGIGFGFPKGTTQNWWQAYASVDSFSRLDEIFKVSVSAKAPPVRAWQRSSSELILNYQGASALGGGTKNLNDYFDRNPATAVLIAKGDTLLLERYQYGRQPEQRFTSFSMAKTIIAMLIGVALEEGRIRSLDDLAQIYAPGLQGTEYGKTPLRHLLTMSSGVEFREDYDGQDDSARLTRATITGQSEGSASLAKLFNRRIAEPGMRWSYASGETFVLAVVLRQAVGQDIASYFSEKIWKPLGAESEATWLVDATNQEIGFMGFNATLRDYGRLGMLMAQKGLTRGQQLVPAAWIKEMTKAQFLPSGTGRWYGYGYQTWVFPDLDGTFAFQGVRGQVIFVDPSRQLVFVHLAVRPNARDPAGGADTVALWQALKRSIPPVKP